jgi:thiamine biosynthesis lipoprotein
MSTLCWMTLVADGAATLSKLASPLLPALRALLLLMLAAGLAACSKSEATRLYGSTMGTTYSVVIPGLPEGITAQSLQETIDTRLAVVNQQMSTYIPDSELSRLNQAPADLWVQVSPELFRLLSLSRSISEQSNGAFDITVGPLVNLWGFGPTDNIPETRPAAEDIESARMITGYLNLDLEAERTAARKHFAELYIDLSSIAKGYGVDVIADYLDSLAIQDYLVEIGGEVRGRGRSHRGDYWRIAVEKPQAGQRRVQRIIEFTESAVATSGDYRNYYEYDGKRYSHTIDPRTGSPVDHGLVSVTVLDDLAANADAWATALMVLGEEAGYELAERRGIAAFFLYRKEAKIVSSETSAFTQRITQTDSGIK